MTTRDVDAMAQFIRSMLAFIRSQACGGSAFNAAAEHIAEQVAEQVERWLATQPADATEAQKLPPLPDPDGYCTMTPAGSVIVPPQDFAKHNAYAIFTAAQLRAYACEAVAAALAAPAASGMTDAARQRAVETIMTEAQVFASAWALVGGRFDDGSGMDAANEAKDELRRVVASVINDLDRAAKKEGGAV